MTKLVFRITAIALILTCGIASAARLDPDLANRLAAADANQKLPVEFFMKVQAYAPNLDPNIPNLPKPQRRARVAQVLKEFADASQHDLLSYLDAKAVEGKVQSISSLWLSNMVGCFATRDVIYDLVARDDISDIVYGLVPVHLERPKLVPKPASRDQVEPNLNVTQAPAAWRMGYTGQNVVVGEVDTGIWYTHEDLRNHLWTSPNYPHCGFNYASSILFPGGVNPSPFDTLDPIDYAIGHGTHCAGIVSADGSYGNGSHDTMGVAPSAKMLVCPSLVYFNSVPGETLLEQSMFLGFQFCVSPPRDPTNGADVITTSLGMFASNQPRYANYRALERNIAAAGISHAIAAGNEGPTPRSIRTPGNCPPPWPNPANHPTDTATSAVITVGATDNSDNAASFTSIGPTDIWGSVPPYNDYGYPPGLTDPDVCAPGVDILSTYWQGDQAYTTMSGTSMATPATAGCIALMLSKNPNLTPRMVDSILEVCAVRDLGPSGKDNTYGAGRINCSLAVMYTPLPGPSHNIALGSILVPGTKVDPATPIMPAVTVVNAGTYDEGAIPVHFQIDSAGTTIYNQTVTLPGLDSAMTDTAIADPWTPGPGGNVYQFTAYHSYSPDTSRMNDTLHRTVTVRGHGMSSASMNIGGRVRAEQPFTPALTLRAADYTEHSVTCYCWIDSAGTRIYDQNTVVDSVPASGTAVASFPVWNIGPTGATYDVTMFNTFDDPNHADDTLHRTAEATDQLRVLIAYADIGGTPDLLINGLTALGDSIDLYDAYSNTPTIGDLTPYDGVITFSNNMYANGAGLGDVLADYVDLGRAVVEGNFALASGWGLSGRIMTGDYVALNLADLSFAQYNLGWYNAAHPIMNGVDTASEYYRTTSTWGAGADSVAKWEDGLTYVATSANQRVVGVNNYPGYVMPERLTGSDWILVYHNALLWASGGGSGLEDKPPFSISPDFTLSQSKPNPFRDRTVISYSVPRALDVNISVYDISGRTVATLVNGRQAAGRYNTTWNRTDGQGNRIASGVYFYKLTSGNYRITRKLVVE
jgi:hypothetical protein